MEWTSEGTVSEITKSQVNWKAVTVFGSVRHYYMIQPKMKVLRSLNNSSYLVTGGFWSPHIISSELFDQLISFVFADTGPPSTSAKNVILAEKRGLLDSSNLDCSPLLLFKKPGPTGFLIIDYKMAD